MIEMLLVLLVLMTVTGIAIPSYRAFETERDEQRYFELLQQDIYYAQSESYRSKAPVTVVFREVSHSSEVVQTFRGALSTRKMPKSVQLKKSSNLKEIHFTGNGSVSGSGTLNFETSAGDKSIVVHLGKGRVVFSE
ncbi:competence protein ComG [Planococcus sp. 107-1]|nr:competence protein ComG [Planococcus sp. 107-1]